jgi:hypothetical protein
VVPDGLVDRDNGVVLANTDHFSTYAALPAAIHGVSVGERHACGLADGRVWWPDRNRGQVVQRGAHPAAGRPVPRRERRFDPRLRHRRGWPSVVLGVRRPHGGHRRRYRDGSIQPRRGSGRPDLPPDRAQLRQLPAPHTCGVTTGGAVPTRVNDHLPEGPRMDFSTTRCGQPASPMWNGVDNHGTRCGFQLLQAPILACRKDL